MEAPRGQFRSVHVLRHTFRPNGVLDEELNKLVNEKPGRQSPRFLLTSTRAVAVDSLDFLNHRYDLDLIEMQRQFNQHVGGVALRSVGYRFANNGDFHLRFLPTSPRELENITQPIDMLADIVESSDKNTPRALTLRIDAKRLVARSALEEAWSNLRTGFKQDAGGQLYRAIPYDISGPERSIVDTSPAAGDQLSA